MGLDREAGQLITKMYRNKSLDTFVCGWWLIKAPAVLPSALHLCLKLENQTFRANHATNKVQTGNFSNQNSKPIPAVRNIQVINRQPPNSQLISVWIAYSYLKKYLNPSVINGIYATDT